MARKQDKTRKDLIKLGKLVNKELYLPEGIRALETKDYDKLDEDLVSKIRSNFHLFKNKEK